jgi:hypothetical protein
MSEMKDHVDPSKSGPTAWTRLKAQQKLQAAGLQNSSKTIDSEAVERGARALLDSPGYIGGFQHAVEDAELVLTAAGANQERDEYKLAAQAEAEGADEARRERNELEAQRMRADERAAMCETLDGRLAQVEDERAALAGEVEVQGMELERLTAAGANERAAIEADRKADEVADAAVHAPAGESLEGEWTMWLHPDGRLSEVGDGRHGRWIQVIAAGANDSQRKDAKSWAGRPPEST